MPPVLRRYLLLEMLPPLATWLTFLFSLLLVMQLLRGSDVLLGSAVGVLDVAQIILYMSPHFLVMALPVALLVAVLFGLGRLADDQEWLAIQALGVSPRSLVAVPLLLGAMVSTAMVGLALGPEARGLAGVKRVMNDVIKRNLVGDVKSGVFYEDLPSLTVYAEKVDAARGRWTNVLLQDEREGVAPLLVVARRGAIDTQSAGAALTLTLTEGNLHRADAAATGYTLLDFETGHLALGVEQSIWRKNKFRSPKEELTPLELWQVGQETQARGGDGRPFLTHFHVRLGQALSPLAFALMGAPMALRRRTSGKNAAFLAALGAYIAYYVLYRGMEQLGATGKLPLLLAGQLPNVILVAVGVFLLVRLARPGASK
ncbi:MAG: LptF/LptG family permease [Myxococcaceae bacterium]